MILVSMLLVAALSALGPAGAAAATVTFADGRVAVKADQEPLREVLDQVARAAGVRIQVHPSRSERVTADLPPTPVDEAVRRLVQDRDVIFVFEEAPAGSGRQRLVAAKVFAKGTGPASRPARRPAAPPVTRLPDEQYQKLQAELAAAEELTRADAVTALARSRDPRAVGLIAPRLRDAEEGVRLTAVEALRDLGGPTAVAALARALEAETSPPVRVEMARALAGLGGPEARGVLVRVFGAERDPAIRVALLEVVASGDRASAEEVLRQGRADPDPLVRETAAKLSSHFARGR